MTPYPGPFDADPPLSPAAEVRELARLLLADPDGRLLLAVTFAPVLVVLLVLGVAVAVFGGR